MTTRQNRDTRFHASIAAAIALLLANVATAQKVQFAPLPSQPVVGGKAVPLIPSPPRVEVEGKLLPLIPSDPRAAASRPSPLSDAIRKRDVELVRKLLAAGE